jgi:hypothetical protein
MKFLSDGKYSYNQSQIEITWNSLIIPNRIANHSISTFKRFPSSNKSRIKYYSDLNGCFAFAILLVSIVNPFFHITSAIPVTKRSLKIIRETIQYSTTPKTANEMKADETRILSARGSKNDPVQLPDYISGQSIHHRHL